MEEGMPQSGGSSVVPKVAQGGLRALREEPILQHQARVPTPQRDRLKACQCRGPQSTQGRELVEHSLQPDTWAGPGPGLGSVCHMDAVTVDEEVHQQTQDAPVAALHPLDIAKATLTLTFLGTQSGIPSLERNVSAVVRAPFIPASEN